MNHIISRISLKIPEIRISLKGWGGGGHNFLILSIFCEISLNKSRLKLDFLIPEVDFYSTLS